MVRVKSHGGVTNRWIVDDGEEANGRVVESVKTSGTVLVNTEGVWFMFRDAYLSFVGNHAFIHPAPTPLDRALREYSVEVDDGA